MSDVPSLNALQAAIDAAEMGGAPPECVKYLRQMVERDAHHRALIQAAYQDTTTIPVSSLYREGVDDFLQPPRRQVQVSRWVPARDTVRAAVDRWFDDPAPKLPGITVRVEMESAFNPPQLLLIMRGTMPGGRCWEHRAIIPEYRLTEGPDVIPWVVMETLERLHRSAIQMLREAPR
jgi:hypothetical protein